MRLTDEQVDELERLEREATSGPWFGDGVLGMVTRASDNMVVARCNSADNANLAFKTRNALPALLAEVREARRRGPVHVATRHPNDLESIADLERQVAELTARLNDAAAAGAELAGENARLRAEVQRLGARLDEQRLKAHRSEDQISDECMAEAEIADENRALQEVAEAARKVCAKNPYAEFAPTYEQMNALRAALAKLDATRK